MVLHPVARAELMLERAGGDARDRGAEGIPREIAGYRGELASLSR
jgi:hypothetical protein